MQEFADVPQLAPQSICQFRDPPYLNALLLKSFVAVPLDATRNTATADATKLKRSDWLQAASSRDSSLRALCVLRKA
jgi:hypothetical protein